MEDSKRSLSFTKNEWKEIYNALKKAENFDNHIDYYRIENKIKEVLYG